MIAELLGLLEPPQAIAPLGRRARRGASTAASAAPKLARCVRGAAKVAGSARRAEQLGLRDQQLR